MPTAPLEIIAAAARKVTADAGIRAAARRAPLAWRNGTSPGPYVVVTQVSPLAADLRGDDATLRERISIQASLWEAESDTDDARLTALIGALDGTRLDVDVVGRVTETLLVPEEDATIVHHAVTVSYRVAR